MKKFKHRESNVEALQTDKVSYSLFVNQTCIGMANAWMIENNEDWIEQVEHKPILTSEDGVELFERDERFVFIPEKCKIYKHIIVNHDPSSDWLYFSTREAAEEYRLLHASKLSIADVKQTIKEAGGMEDLDPVVLISFLGMLVRSRLNE